MVFTATEAVVETEQAEPEQTDQRPSELTAS